MKYPKYGVWCKQNVIETVRGQKIKETKKCLEELIFNSDMKMVYLTMMCQVFYGLLMVI